MQESEGMRKVGESIIRIKFVNDAAGCFGFFFMYYLLYTREK